MPLSARCTLQHLLAVSHVAGVAQVNTLCEMIDDYKIGLEQNLPPVRAACHTALAGALGKLRGDRDIRWHTSGLAGMHKAAQAPPTGPRLHGATCLHAHTLARSHTARSHALQSAHAARSQGVWSYIRSNGFLGLCISKEYTPPVAAQAPPVAAACPGR